MASPEGLRAIISDFDGTLTEESGNEYEAAVADEFAKRLDMSHADLTPVMEQAKADIIANPDTYGWEIAGQIVAPATSDRFLLSTAMIRRTVHLLGRDETADAEKLASDIFGICYPLAKTQFRDGAREYLEELDATGKFFIITNSKTDKVSARIAELLGPDHGINVIGNAKKFVVADGSRSVTMPGLARPVFADRPIYENTLNALLAGSDRGVVVGDIAELDLVAPMDMGVRGMLLASSSTPQWEIDYVAAHPLGRVVRSLTEAATHIRSML